MISKEIKEKFPDLDVRFKHVKELAIKRESDELEEFKKETVEEIKNSYNLDTLKDDPQMRLYRDFFWKIDIDPTKIRPASEALIRRILAGKPLPQINTAVDAYNLASIKSGVPLAAFDFAHIEGELKMRFAKEGEQFTGIGMKEPKVLKGNEIVIEDRESLVAIYPYRDADKSKITTDTTEILLMSCGVPGVPGEKLDEAAELAVEYLRKFCKG
jgi:DNA/RNA-binding domain of Phe-tRNA-synthetase-like protein